MAHRYSLMRHAAVRRVRPANSPRDRRECVRRRVQRAGSPAAAALGRGFSRRRGTCYCPAEGGERQKVHLDLGGAFPLIPPIAASQPKSGNDY